MHFPVNFIKAVVFGVFGAALVCAMSQTVGYHTLLRIQNTIDDSHFDIWKKRAPADDGIVIVDADSVSLQMLGNFKRWPRRHFTSVLDRLHTDGARLVFLDVMFMRGGLASENRALADTVMSGGNVIIGYYLQLDPRSLRRKPTDSVSSERLVKRSPANGTEFLRAWNMDLPIPELVFSARKLGFTNCIPDPDGILRRIPLFIGYRRSTLSSASLQMWMYLKGIKASGAVRQPNGTRSGETFLPTDRYGFMRSISGIRDTNIPDTLKRANGRFAPERPAQGGDGRSVRLPQDLKRVPAIVRFRVESTPPRFPRCSAVSSYGSPRLARCCSSASPRASRRVSFLSFSPFFRLPRHLSPFHSCCMHGRRSGSCRLRNS